MSRRSWSRVRRFVRSVARGGRSVSGRCSSVPGRGCPWPASSLHGPRGRPVSGWCSRDSMYWCGLPRSCDLASPHAEYCRECVGAEACAGALACGAGACLACAARKASAGTSIMSASQDILPQRSFHFREISSRLLDSKISFDRPSTNLQVICRRDTFDRFSGAQESREKTGKRPVQAHRVSNWHPAAEQRYQNQDRGAIVFSLFRLFLETARLR